MADEPYNSAERRHVREAAKAARLTDRENREFIEATMSLIQGRKWMHSLLERCHVFRTTFDRNALVMSFAEGERNVGAQILTDIVTFTPDAYVQMMREANERNSVASARRQPPTEPDSVVDPGAERPADDTSTSAGDPSAHGWNLVRPEDLGRGEARTIPIE